MTPALPVDIPQFAAGEEACASGLQPYARRPDLAASDNGYRTVLHVRLPGEDDSADREQIEKRGLQLPRLELSPETLTKEKTKEFNRIVNDESNLPLFVYDRDGMLAGGLWYLYLRTSEILSDDDARTKAARSASGRTSTGPCGKRSRSTSRSRACVAWAAHSLIAARDDGRHECLPQPLHPRRKRLHERTAPAAAGAGGRHALVREPTIHDQRKPGIPLGESRPAGAAALPVVRLHPARPRRPRPHHERRGAGLHLRPRRPPQRPPPRRAAGRAWKAATGPSSAAPAWRPSAPSSWPPCSRATASSPATASTAAPRSCFTQELGPLRRADRLRRLPTTSTRCAAALETPARLLFVETMSNPLLRVVDLAALAELAHERGCLLVVDNTFATPVLTRPLELGADLVMESLTKMIGGHSDVTLGAGLRPRRPAGRR